MKNKTLLVSIIITCYNYAEYIEASIKSALSQTYENIELIIINDGSTDDSLGVIGKYSNQAKIISRENKGIVHTRNEGLKATRGEFICFLDADDYFNSDYIEKSVAIAQKHDADVVFPNWRVFGDEVYNTDFKEFDLQLLIKQEIHCTSESLIRRSSIKGHWFESEEIAEDWDFFLGLALAGKKFKLAKDNYINYRVHKGTRGNSKPFWDDMYYFCKILAKWQVKYPDLVNAFDLPISVGRNKDDHIEKLTKAVQYNEQEIESLQEYNSILRDSTDYKVGKKIIQPIRLIRNTVRKTLKLPIKVLEVVLPHNSSRREVVKKIHNTGLILAGRKQITPKTSIDYSEWINKKENSLWSKLPDSAGRPLISVVVPTYNTPDKYLEPLIDSLIRQTYDKWQLCVSDASTENDRQRAIEETCTQDSRITYQHNPGLHISDNTNKGLALARGEYIGLLDHDDTLSPHALEEVAVVIDKYKEPDIIYSDEDKLSDNGLERSLPFFKPDWSPDLLLGVNYITHFLVIKKKLIDEVGGLRSDYNGAQDYDLLLRVTEETDKIVHIPKILYHWRLADGSTSKNVGEKNYADNAGQLALRDAIKRRNIKADVIEITERPTNYRLRYILPKEQPFVSIIIPFKDHPELLSQCIASILSKTLYKNYEIILISNNSVEKETKELVETLKLNKGIRAFVWDYSFNYSKINNFGVAKAKGEYIILLNNDTEVITPEWLDELVGVASQPGVGVVGPMLLYPDKKNGIQHAGIVLGMGTMAGHVFRHRQPGDWTDFGIPAWPRNYLAVTAACLIVSKKLYNKVGGLDETFTVAGNDVAFCLRLHEEGYRNVLWPFASLYHYESVSVGSYNNGIQLDYDHSLTYYKPYHQSGDPYFNKNLDLMNEQIGIGVTNE